MVYWIWTVFIGFFIWINVPYESLMNKDDLDKVSQRQAIALLDYADKLNEWRYQHPEFQQGVISDIKPEIEGANKLNNIVVNNRLYVWCNDMPGLMYALKYHSRSSAMIKRVTHDVWSHSDIERMDFVPQAISEGSLVYYN